MRRLALTLLLALALQNAAPAQETPESPVAANKLTAEQNAAGWVLLFDGKTLEGWKPTSKADWKVVDGEIRVSSGDEGWLMTMGEFTDYELHVEFKAPATTNSGVFLRTPLEPKDPTKDCYEINIAPRDNGFPTGSLVGRVKIDLEHPTSWLAPLAVNAWDGDWHTFDVTMTGSSIHVKVDDMAGMPAPFTDEISIPGDRRPRTTDRGRIGLQFREGEVAFRNIRIKVLDQKMNHDDTTNTTTDKVD